VTSRAVRDKGCGAHPRIVEPERVTPQLTRDYLERGGAALEGSTAPPTGFNGGSLALSDVVGPLTGRHTVGDIH
jgi:hypothetical protein